jgi:hypothetical protein
MQYVLIVYGIAGALSAALVAILARQQQIPMSSDTYNINTGAVTWFISCFFTWPVVLPAFFVKRHDVLNRRNDIIRAPLPQLPTIPSLGYCVVWSTIWWCVVLPLYLAFFIPNFATDKTFLTRSMTIALTSLLGIPIGLLAGSLDWWWNRKPYFSTLKQRWFNQAGIGSILAGGATGCLIALTEFRPQVSYWDGPYMGLMAGGLLGIVVAVIYKYSALYFRFIIES